MPVHSSSSSDIQHLNIDTYQYLNDKLDRIIMDLEKEGQKKDLINIISLLLALSATGVSAYAAISNFKAFRGQTLYTLKSNWADRLSENISDFVITAAELYTPLAKGLLPPSYMVDILLLKKSHLLISFSLKKTGILDSTIYDAMLRVIGLIEKVRNDASKNSDSDFAQYITTISDSLTAILSDNWVQIVKFK